MATFVQKYGGTSVGSVERINAVAERVKRWHDDGHRVVVVVSAMSGETNRLESLGYEIAGQPDPREMDVLLSSGEQASVALLAMALMQRGCKSRSYLGTQIRMQTDANHMKARIENIETSKLDTDLDAGIVPVVAGFQGVGPNGDITTFGRGGSDTTAVAVAAALKADECQIYTDVDGVYTADPRVVPTARRLESVTFEEMFELASLGSKVLHSRSVEFVGKYGVPLRVLSSFEDGPGTLITTEDRSMEQPIVSGVTYARDEAKLTLTAVPDVPGVASRILSPIGAASIEVDMIVQNIGGDGTTDFTFTVRRADFDRAHEILLATGQELNAGSVTGDDKIAKVSAVGVGMRSHAGVATTMFDALGHEGINIQMISTSEIKISVVVEERELENAVRVIHTAFGLDDDAVDVEED